MTFLVFICTWMALIFVGIPIAVAMFVVSIGYFLYTGIGINFAAQRVVDGLNSFPIIAVPLFILAASIFNSSSITRNLFGFATALQTVKNGLPSAFRFRGVQTFGSQPAL